MGGVWKLLKKNWFGIISLALSFGLFAFFLTFSGGYEHIREAVVSMDPFWLGLALLATLLFWLADAAILHVLIKAPRFFLSFRTCMIGLLYNNLTPFATGGQPLQILDMSSRGVSVGNATLFIGIKTIFYQTSLTVYSIAAIFFSFTFFQERVPNFILLISVGLCLNVIFVTVVLMMMINRELSARVAAFVVRWLGKWRILKNPEKTLSFLLGQIGVFQDSAVLLRRRVSMLVAALLFTVAQLTIFFLLPYCIYRSFHMTGGSLGLILCAQAIITMITAFIPMPGATGAAEGGFYLFFSIFFTQAAMLPAIFIWRFLTYYLCMLVGGLVTVLGKKNRG